MREIIDGNIYDTETAENLCQHEEGKIGNWWWILETLYVTPEGNYFMHATGGCGTQYAVQEGNRMVGNRYTIYPVSEYNARVTLELNCPRKALELFY